MEPFWISIGIGAFLFVVLVLTFVWMAFYQRSFCYDVHGKQVVVTVKSMGVFLYINGNLEEQFSAQGIRLVTLKASIDGEEILVHISRRGFRLGVKASYAGKEIYPVQVAK